MKYLLVFLLVGLIASCGNHSKEESKTAKSTCDYIEIQKKCFQDIIKEKSFESIVTKYSKSKKEFKHLLNTSGSREAVIDELRDCIKKDDDYQKLKIQADEISRRQGWDYIPGVLPEFKHGNDPLNSMGSLIQFDIQDTSSITKIIITDPYSNTIELLKKRNTWTDANGGCITQAYVNNILDIAKNIEFKGYLSKNSHANYKKQMSSYHTKVELYFKNKWYKTWYIGPPSADHYGQVMLLSTIDQGKSSEPLMMKIKGVNGIIEPNFFADARKWSCTNIFSLSKDQIEQVEIIDNENPEWSFRIDKIENGHKVSKKGKRLRDVDLSNLNRYLSNYKKIHFDLPNYVLNKQQCDSVKRSKPFCELILTDVNNNTTHLKMFRIKSQEPQRNEFGELVHMDMNKFWCELSDGTLVKCQYHVFNPLIFGHIYFPSLDG